MEYKKKQKLDKQKKYKEEEAETANLWNQTGQKLLACEEIEKEKCRNIARKIADFNRQMALDNVKKVEEKILAELVYDQNTKNQLKKEDKDFYEYAKKCIGESQTGGKQVTPLLLEMKKYKDFLLEGAL